MSDKTSDTAEAVAETRVPIPPQRGLRRLSDYGDRAAAKSFISARVWQEIRGDREAIERYYRGLNKNDRYRMLATLSAVYTGVEIEAMLGASKMTIHRALKQFPDIAQAGRVVRSEAIGTLADQRAMQLLASMDVTKIPDAKKAQSIKYLVDSSDVASRAAAPERDRERDEDTMSLVFKIKRRLKQPPAARVVDAADDAIDVTADVERLGDGQPNGG